MSEADPAPVVDPASPPVTDPPPATPDPAKPADPAPAPSGEPKKPAASIVEEPGDGKPSPATWPDDWRQRLAGDDEKFLKTLERMTDPSQLGKSYREAERKLKETAALPKKPGKDAKPEEVAAYRQALGIPEKAEDYKIELPNGRVLGDDDKPLFAEFTARMHAANAPPEILSAAADWYLDHQQKLADELIEKDEAFKIEARDALRDDWGQEFKPNINAIGAMFDGAPEGVKDRLLGGRTADGRKIGDDPAVLRFLAGIAREINPAATVMPAGATQPGKGLEDRIKEIEQIMATDQRKYWSDNAIQEEYGRLLAAREKMQARGQAAA